MKTLEYTPLVNTLIELDLIPKNNQRMIHKVEIAQDILESNWPVLESVSPYYPHRLGGPHQVCIRFQFTVELHTTASKESLRENVLDFLYNLKAIIDQTDLDPKNRPIEKLPKSLEEYVGQFRKTTIQKHRTLYHLALLSCLIPVQTT